MPLKCFPDAIWGENRGSSMLSETEQVVETIYEAAVIPEHWPKVLERLGAIADASAASLIAFKPDGSLRYITTESYKEAFSDYATNGAHLENLRPKRALELAPVAFVHDLEVCSQEELDNDPIYVRFGRPYGFGWTAGTVVPVPSGDILVFDLAKRTRQGPFNRGEMERLDPLRPHLARAGLLAHRLGLRAARSATDALAAIGLPGAALARAGRVLSANPLLLSLAPRINIGAFDRIRIAGRRASAMLDIAVARAADGLDCSVRSIPIPPSESANALVLHIVPVRREAQDLFRSTAALLVVTEVAHPEAPLTNIITGLFDLTPSEARVLQGLSAGLTIEAMAKRFGTGRETVRTQTKSVYRKTGTTGQIDLLLLLQGARPLRSL